MLCCAQPCADKHVHCALHVGWENEYHYLSCVSECQGEGLCVSVISCVLLYSVCLCSGLQILKDCCKLHTHHELVVATVMNLWNSHSTTNTYTTSGPPFLFNTTYTLSSGLYTVLCICTCMYVHNYTHEYKLCMSIKRWYHSRENTCSERLLL